MKYMLHANTIHLAGVLEKAEMRCTRGGIIFWLEQISIKNRYEQQTGGDGCVCLCKERIGQKQV